jgi:hypothetical protein
MHWWAVVPTAAVVSAVVTLLIRWLDQPRPVLRLEAGAKASEKASSGLVAVNFSLINFGDGDAFDVRVFGSGCNAGIPACAPGNLWTYRMTVLKGGESVPVQISSKPYKVTDNDRRAVIVTYSPRPRRSFRRTHRFEFRDLPVPSWLPPMIFEPATIPWWVRRTRSLEKRTPTARLYLRPRDTDGISIGVDESLTTSEGPDDQQS